MSKRSYSQKTKKLALDRVSRGVTYELVRERLKVPKSTLSWWARSKGKTVDRSKQIAHLARAREAALRAIAIKKSERVVRAESDAQSLANAVPVTKREISKSLLAMLYWAEGGKQEGNLKFTNTDPDLVLLFLSLLRKSYPLDETRLHIARLIHSYHDQSTLINFWSEKLDIPPSQFWKTYIKPRSGRKKQYRRNFYGICNLHYASTPIQRELLALGRALGKRLD